jgi:hypothetical protein
MSEFGQRMLDESIVPDARSISKWIRSTNYQRWTQLLRFIESNYPGVFAPDWLFGGKKHGWGLRFKRSQSFCTLIPERNRLVIQIVFGRAERQKAEAILRELSPSVSREYVEAKTYHDGKWLAIAVDRDQILEDVKRLLAIKRKPKSYGIRSCQLRR